MKSRRCCTHGRPRPARARPEEAFASPPPVPIGLPIARAAEEVWFAMFSNVWILVSIAAIRSMTAFKAGAVAGVEDVLPMVILREVLSV